jgi:hypothetical protein
MTLSVTMKSYKQQILRLENSRDMISAGLIIKEPRLPHLFRCLGPLVQHRHMSLQHHLDLRLRQHIPHKRVLHRVQHYITQFIDARQVTQRQLPVRRFVWLL